MAARRAQGGSVSDGGDAPKPRHSPPGPSTTSTSPHIVSLAGQQLANPGATKRAKSLAAGILAKAPRKAGAAVPKRKAR